MRDGLTFLAGLLLLALLTALVGPAFVDWSQQRALVEQQLRRVAGVDLVTTGPIHVRLLPTPRLKINGLRIGDADPLSTRLTAGVLRAELELAPLLRGELYLGSILLDRAEITLATRNGAILPPATFTAPGLMPAAIGQFTVTRGQVTALDERGERLASLPFSLDASLPPLGGAARIDGEIAGRSIRLTTGDRDAGGRLRVKLGTTDGATRADFDGWTGVEKREGGFVLRPDGQLSLAVLKPGEPQPALTAAGRLQAAAGGLTLTGLALELAGGGRLEGEASWAAGPGQAARVALQTRRADLGLWLGQREQVEASLAASIRPLGLSASALPETEVTLAADQIGYRGEEATETQFALRWREGRWRAEGGQAKFAGASARFRRIAENRYAASLDAPDLRRVALAMQRLDMPQGLAEDIAALGQMRVEADLSPTAEGWRIARWQAQGRFGEARGDADSTERALAVRGAFASADALFLVRPITALASLSVVDLDLSFTGERMRIGASPPGSGSMRLQRGAGRWRIDGVSLRGFDGLELDASRPNPAEPLRFTVSAARADAISALAERFTQSSQATQVVRALRGVAPVRLEGTVGERGDEWLASASGRAGPLMLEASGRADRSGAWRGGEVSLAARERGVLFRALGLPEPANGAVPTRLGLRLADGGPTLTLSGEEGLSVEARGRWAPGAAGQLAGPMDLNFTAPVLANVMPGLGAGGFGGGITGTARLRLGEGLIALDAIEARSGDDAIRGALEIVAGGPVSGRLQLPAVDLTRLAGWVTGPLQAASDPSTWSGARFGEPARLPALQLELLSPRIALPIAGVADGGFKLSLAEGSVRLSEIRLSTPEGTFTGTLEAERQGGLLALRTAGEARNLDLARLLGGDISGRGDLSFQFGGSGESPARLVASLAGAGQLVSRDLALQRVDPTALERITASLNTDIITPDPVGLAQTVRRAVEAAPWRIAETSLAIVMAGGVARLSPIADERPQTLLNAQGFVDLRSGQAELRAAMQLRQAPQGWLGQPPQIALTWRGPWRAPTRAYDVSVLSNSVSQKALQREIERVEAYEADIRERAAFNRRLRAERERREAEQRAAAFEARQREEQARAERAREEQARADRLREELERQREERARALAPSPFALPAPASAAPPLPPPLNINPVPSPFSRPPLQLN